MKKLVLTIFSVLNLTVLFAQTYNEKYGQPIVVLIETNPWLMVIGSDVPDFALYENGQIIYKKTSGDKTEYFEVQNNREKTQQIIKSFGITDGLMKQKDFTEASTWTDQLTNILILNFDTLRQIIVYGNLRENSSEERQKTPKDYLTVYDNILAFNDNAAKQWLPEAFEVMVTDFSYSQEEPIAWKKEWNDLKSANTVKRSEDLYSIYLDKKYFNDFISFLKSIKQKQAVEINGKKFSLSYRLPFPNL